MAVTIRLMRFGKKGYAAYRIVALDKRKKRDGSYIEKVGEYNPMQNPAKILIKKERFDYWTKNGAEISEGVQKLLKHPKKINFEATKAE
jgi:small subunit ribosomal protein S16